MPADLSQLAYPRHVHKPSVPGDWQFQVVTDPVACAAALAAGWSLTPIVIDAPAGVYGGPAVVADAAPAPVDPPTEKKPGRKPFRRE